MRRSRRNRGDSSFFRARALLALACALLFLLLLSRLFFASLLEVVIWLSRHSPHLWLVCVRRATGLPRDDVDLYHLRNQPPVPKPR